MSKKANFKRLIPKIGHLTPTLASRTNLWPNFIDYALRYVGGIIEPIKLDFRGLKGQFHVKKVNFRGLIAKIGHVRPLFASRTHHFHGICHGNCDLKFIGVVLELRKINFRGLESQFENLTMF